MSPEGVPQARPFGEGSVSLGLHPHGDDGPGQAEAMVAEAVTAERAGFDGVTVSEHHAGFPGYMPQPVLASNWILAATTRLWSGPNPVLLGLRNPRLLAEELAWTEARFGGRIGATVVAGYAESDFDAVGVPHGDRLQRFPAQIDELLGALDRETGPLAGDPAVGGSRVSRCLQVGVNSTQAVRRGAQHALGIVFPGGEAAPRLGALSSEYREAGGAGVVMCIANVWLGAGGGAASRSDDVFRRAAAPGMRMSTGFRQGPIVGEAGDVGDQLVEYLSTAGATAVNLRLNAPGVGGTELLEQIERVGEQLLPTVRAQLGAAVGSAVERRASSGLPRTSDRISEAK